LEAPGSGPISYRIRRQRGVLHRARREGLDAQNREGRTNFRAWLAGKIAYVRMSRPEVGEERPHKPLCSRKLGF
jgi:hypothetical protein